MKPEGDTGLSAAEYTELLAFRTALRRFLRWSEGQARAVGLTPAQHQLLLAIKGHPGKAAPTVGELSDHLVSRHHSVVELVDRAVEAGLVRRVRDDEDHRVVHLHLTRRGGRCIEKLSQSHREELRRLAQVLGWAHGGVVEVDGMRDDRACTPEGGQPRRRGRRRA